MTTAKQANFELSRYLTTPHRVYPKGFDPNPPSTNLIAKERGGYTGQPNKTSQQYVEVACELFWSPTCHPRNAQHCGILIRLKEWPGKKTIPWASLRRGEKYIPLHYDMKSGTNIEREKGIHEAIPPLNTVLPPWLYIIQIGCAGCAAKNLYCLMCSTGPPEKDGWIPVRPCLRCFLSGTGCHWLSESGEKWSIKIRFDIKQIGPVPLNEAHNWYMFAEKKNPRKTGRKQAKIEELEEEEGDEPKADEARDGGKADPEKDNTPDRDDLSEGDVSQVNEEGVADESEEEELLSSAPSVEDDEDAPENEFQPEPTPPAKPVRQTKAQESEPGMTTRAKVLPKAPPKEPPKKDVPKMSKGKRRLTSVDETPDLKRARLAVKEESEVKPKAQKESPKKTPTTARPSSLPAPEDVPVRVPETSAVREEGLIEEEEGSESDELGEYVALASLTALGPGAQQDPEDFHAASLPDLVGKSPSEKNKAPVQPVLTDEEGLDEDKEKFQEAMNVASRAFMSSYGIGRRLATSQGVKSEIFARVFGQEETNPEMLEGRAKHAEQQIGVDYSFQTSESTDCRDLPNRGFAFVQQVVTFQSQSEESETPVFRTIGRGTHVRIDPGFLEMYRHSVGPVMASSTYNYSHSTGKRDADSKPLNTREPATSLAALAEASHGSKTGAWVFSSRFNDAHNLGIVKQKLRNTPRSHPTFQTLFNQHKAELIGEMVREKKHTLLLAPPLSFDAVEPTAKHLKTLVGERSEEMIRKPHLAVSLGHGYPIDDVLGAYEDFIKHDWMGYLKMGAIIDIASFSNAITVKAGESRSQIVAFREGPIVWPSETEAFESMDQEELAKTLNTSMNVWNKGFHLDKAHPKYSASQPLKLDECDLITGINLLGNHSHAFIILPGKSMIYIYDGKSISREVGGVEKTVMMNLLKNQATKDGAEGDWNGEAWKMHQRQVIHQKDTWSCMYLAAFLVDVVLSEKHQAITRTGLDSMMFGAISKDQPKHLTVKEKDRLLGSILKRILDEKDRSEMLYMV